MNAGCPIDNFTVVKSVAINNVIVELLQYSSFSRMFRYIPCGYRYTYTGRRLSDINYTVVWRDINSIITEIPFKDISTFSKPNKRFNLLVKTIQLNKTQFVKL